MRWGGRDRIKESNLDRAAGSAMRWTLSIRVNVCPRKWKIEGEIKCKRDE